VPDGTDDGEVLTVSGDGTAKRSPLSDYPAKGRGGKGLMTGTDELLWCGLATDVHVGGEPPRLLRPIDVGEAKRAGRGTALEGEVAGPVAPETNGAE
jgi:DNA gyrase subunit A